MKIVIAPDSFKGSLTSVQAATAIETGIKKAYPTIETVKVPMGDGGEGTIDALLSAIGGEIKLCKTHDPIGRNTAGKYGILADENTAVIEIAQASGLTLLKTNERKPMIANTIGTGELILDALDNGIRNIILGLGGSATTDCGTGMAHALGVRFYDENDQIVIPSGQTLGTIRRIDTSNLDERLKEVEFMVACDVENPLCGKTGAAHVYGPQKGASPADVLILDKNLADFAKLVYDQLDINVRDIPGSGAAGGLGAGVIIFLDAKLRKGVEIVAQMTNLEHEIESADLVITGEGCIDISTMYGKTLMGVVEIANKFHAPTIGIAGSLGKDYMELFEYGFSGLFTIVDGPMSEANALENAATLLEQKTENIIRFWLSTQ